jgi:SAM-dependent methyltransferase
MSLSRQYVKLCELEDFDDPELLAMAASILPERDARTHIERKVWEFAMLALFMDEAGLLDDGTEALSVGAGDERILFWLANRIGHVVATDVYGEGEFVDGSAQASMLDDPGAHAPFPYREDHLEVLFMDGRRLTFPDASFDLVFTLSSIEHFGSPADIARSAREIGRVLRPGGYAVIVTECLVRLHPLDTWLGELPTRIAQLRRRPRDAIRRRRRELGQMLTARELRSLIVRPSGLRLVQPLDLTVSPSSWENLTLLAEGGRLSSRTGSKYPMILIQVSRSVFTSVCLILEKPGSPDSPNWPDSR